MNIALSILILSPVVLAPIGAVYLLVLGRKHRWGKVVASILLLCFAGGLILFYPVPLYAFDSLVGWELRLPVEIPGYTVTLVQKPGFDFYESYFEITRGDGGTARVLIDSDDYRWWRAETIQRDGRIYFVRDFGEIGDRTSYVDDKNDVIFSGYS